MSGLQVNGGLVYCHKYKQQMKPIFSFIRSLKPGTVMKCYNCESSRVTAFMASVHQTTLTCPLLHTQDVTNLL